MSMEWFGRPDCRPTSFVWLVSIAITRCHSIPILISLLWNAAKSIPPLCGICQPTAALCAFEMTRLKRKAYAAAGVDIALGNLVKRGLQEKVQTTFGPEVL